MGVAERTDAPVPGSKTPLAESLYGGSFECFFFVQWRQQAGQTCGEHRLAGAGRTEHEQVVAAAGRDFQCTPTLVLAAYVGKVGIFAAARIGRHAVRGSGQRRTAIEVPTRGVEGIGRVHRE